MKLFKYVAFIVLISGLTSISFAKVKITDIATLKSDNNQAKISISFDGELAETPKISTKNGIVQVAIPDSIVWPKIERNVKLGNVDSTLMAYQFSKDLVRFRALIPYSLEKQEEQISLSIKDSEIILSFPIANVETKTSVEVKTNVEAKMVSSNYRRPAVLSKPENVTKIPTKISTKEAPKIATDYDEGYLQSLLTDKKMVETSKQLFPTKEESEDKVAMALSGVDKSDSGSDMALMTMVGKFFGFLILVLGVFFMIVNAFKKGVMKKGKLGFLNNTDVVTVLNTTYIGHKKSLMLIKVHKQVFLISNDEKGMTFLSEVTDTTGLLKDGEEAISGGNFDTNLNEAKIVEKEFKLKDITAYQSPVENITEDGDSLAMFLKEKPVVDQVKLSDQIKNKVKNLKALQ